MLELFWNGRKLTHSPILRRIRSEPGSWGGGGERGSKLDRMNILVTGGCGFIGANFMRRMVPRHPEHQFLNLDALTYAGNPLSLREIEDLPNYDFAKVNLAHSADTHQVVEAFQPDWVIHFAAETHVDRSIKFPGDFIQSNIIGTFNLLESCRTIWSDQFTGRIFHHVSTDEVFGELGETGAFSETTPYDPSSPYSASKASSDHLVRAWNHTYGLPVKITNCSNNYGPFQFPEKLIPVMVLKGLAGEALPVYGRGANIRDWLYVNDHVDAIWTVLERGEIGETYAIGGNSERTNLQVVEAICRSLARLTEQSEDHYMNLISFVADRPGHDFRYAIDASKIREKLGWEPSVTFEEGLHQTVEWYLQNPEWINSVKTGAYREWIDTHYGKGANA